MKFEGLLGAITLVIFAAHPCLAAPKGAVDNKKSAAKASLKSPKSSSQSTAKAPASLQGDFGKEPTYVKSDSLTLLSEARKFTYAGNVEVTQGDMTIIADFIDGNYDEKNQIQDIVARKNITITKGPEIRATGERAIYNKANETLVLTDNPELQQKGSVLTADKITIYLKENRSAAEGQVRVKLEKNSTGTTDFSTLTGR